MLVLIVAILSLSEISIAGVEIGNGGDVVQCQPSVENSLSGYYSLDYLLTYDSTAELIEPNSWQQSMELLSKVLKTQLPDRWKGQSHTSRH